MSTSHTGSGKSAHDESSELTSDTIAKMSKGKGLVEQIQRGHKLRARLNELKAEASEVETEVDLDNPQQADAYANLCRLWNTNDRTVQAKFQEESRKVQDALKDAATQRQDTRTLRQDNNTLRQENNTLRQKVDDLIPSKSQHQEAEGKLQEADFRREAAEKTLMEDRKRTVALEGLLKKALKLSDDQPIPIDNAEQYDELLNTVERILDQIHEAVALKCTVENLEGELKAFELMLQSLLKLSDERQTLNKLEEAETRIKRAVDELSSRRERIKDLRSILFDHVVPSQEMLNVTLNKSEQLMFRATSIVKASHDRSAILNRLGIK